MDWPSTESSTTIVNPSSGRCLDIPAHNMSDGTKPAIWDCNGGDNQRWQLTDAGELRATVNGVTKCLDAEGRGTADGTAILIWTCNGGDNQKWAFNGTGQIVGRQSGKCLQVQDEATANGATMKLSACRSTDIGSQAFVRG
ncbi:RICIN domain-containing protein [Streptomyces sp. WAC 06738]|uniref:RICIN domain-containing protein n=1 Tax=Streptomyces sp. WAC 06738 TaxID=2203210 RepID=UPI003204CCF9